MQKIQFHIFIMGFTQDRLQWTGTEAIRQAVKNLPEMNCPRVEIFLPFRWSADMGAVAEYIKRNCTGSEPDVYVYAYSWGAGRGFIALAKQLLKRGYKIQHAILCDPVYHSWSRLWRGMFSFKWNPPIVIPHNVKCVTHFYQRNNVPQAATLKVEDVKKTKLLPGVQLDRTHEFMDDSPEYFNAVLDLVKSVSPDEEAADG